MAEVGYQTPNLMEISTLLRIVASRKKFNCTNSVGYHKALERFKTETRIASKLRYSIVVGSDFSLEESFNIIVYCTRTFLWKKIPA